jgi:hypothetical protein
MKKKILTVLVLLAALAVTAFLVVSLFSNSLSDSQQQTRDMFGAPDQFVITYLPRGTDEETEMVRSEVWYYKNAQKKVSFLAGELIATDDHQLADDVVSTPFLPEDIDVLMNFSEIQKALQTQAITQVQGLPVFDSEDVKTYLSKDALFIIEQGYLTYFQTLSEGEVVEYSEPTQTPTLTTPSVNIIQNEVYNFTIQLPQDWYLEENDVVLSNYDTDYLTNNQEPPTNPLKCDFSDQEITDASLDGGSQVYENDDLAITRHSIANFQADGPGYGDGVVFKILSSANSPLYLICFMFNEEGGKLLEEALNSFSYVKQ